MARSAILLSCLLVLLSDRVSAVGTKIALWNITNFEGTGRVPLTVLPTPRSGVPAGCYNLPAGFVPRSGRFYWDSSDAAATWSCRHVIFYYEPNCGRKLDINGEPVGGEQAIKRTVWGNPTTIADFSALLYSNKIVSAKSVGCNFSPDPCVALPCADPNAQCVSSTIKVIDAGVEIDARNTRSCRCKEGLVLVGGLCKDPCASFSCPASATCRLDSAYKVFCQCPDTFTWNAASNTCQSVAAQLWLTPLNKLRVLNGVTTPLLWNANMAKAAADWAATMSNSQCNNAPNNVVLSRIPNTPYSQNNAFISSTTAESAAISLWVPPGKETDTTIRHLARIVSVKTVEVGCGKAPCDNFGAFFVCLFSPKTAR